MGNDISSWTSVQIVAKIRELENEKENLWIEYVDKKADINKQINELQDMISNRRIIEGG